MDDEKWSKLVCRLHAESGTSHTAIITDNGHITLHHPPRCLNAMALPVRLVPQAMCVTAAVLS
jgi:hypothetical protein